MSSRPHIRLTTGAALGAAALALVAASCAEPADTEEHQEGALVVDTEQGPVRGAAAEDHRSFLGIPYAAPPEGELRFAPPQPAEPWDRPLEADEPGGACPQPEGRPTSVPSEDEDCLYLNVATPDAAAPDSELPVMVWLHGGDFNSSAGDVYGPGRLAAEGDVMVVSVNYRLGALGFLAHPELDGDSPRGESGNYGLQDQQAALQWVQDNAAAFGGDPDNVTLFGESAGATAACAHLTSPEAEGLFHRVILQSATCATPWSPVTDTAPRPREQAEAQGAELAARLEEGGCEAEDAAACLREATVAEIAEASGDGEGFGPVVGGTLLPAPPGEAIRDGDFHRIPVLQGANRDEYRLHAWGLEIANGHPLTGEEYAEHIGGIVGDDAGAVLRRYPASDYDSPSLAFAAAMTDRVYAERIHATTERFAAEVPTYAYEFAEADNPWFAGVEPPGYPMGAFHSAELPYLFDVDYAEALTSAQRDLGSEMIGYWTRFARTGDPNGGDAPEWPQYDPEEPAVQVLAAGEGGDGGAPVDYAEAHNYAFWSSIGW